MVEQVSVVYACGHAKRYDPPEDEFDAAAALNCPDCLRLAAEINEPLMPGDAQSGEIAPEPAPQAPPATHLRLIRVPAPICPDHGKTSCLSYVDTADDGASLYVCTKAVGV